MNAVATVPDDRITCAADCVMFGRVGSRCRADNCAVIPDLPRRCEHFKPIAGSRDKRTGKQRWPHLVKLWDER